MRILFYLPVVTPWWFDNIVIHLIRACAQDAEVHVIVPPIWNNTGIGIEQLQNCLDLETVQWHVWDSDNHAAIRTSAAAEHDLLALIEQIDADYTICRSADLDTPQRFPGEVRFLMEGQIAGLPCPSGWVTLPERILEFGAMPPLDGQARGLIESDFDPFWQRLTKHWQRRADSTARDAYCERAGLPTDSKIIAMPLEYEHHENFFLMHRQYESNLAFVQEVAERIDDRFVLAVTEHPLNLLHARNRPLERMIKKSGGQIRLVPDLEGPRTATEALFAHADGVVVGDSKTIAAAAFFGLPIYRRSRFATAPWMNAYDDLDIFLEAVATGDAKRPSAEDVKLWFAYHVANDVVDLKLKPLSAGDVIDYFEHPVSAERWRSGRARIDRMAAAWKAA